MSHAADVRAGYRYVLSPTGEIYPGWYATRLGKGELEVGCLVTYGPAEDPVTGETLDRSPQLVVWIDGSISYAHMGSGRKFLMGRPVTQEEYERLLGTINAPKHTPLRDLPLPF